MKAVTLTARTKDTGMYQMHFMLCPVMYQKYILYQKSVRSEKTGHRLEGLIPAGKQMILSADGKIQLDYAQHFITKCCACWHYSQNTDYSIRPEIPEPARVRAASSGSA